MKHLDNYKFNPVERGDRMNPARSSRVYWHLRLLLDKIRRVADSDLLSPGEKLLDYGCGNKPYHPLFSRKFSQYVGADLPGNPAAEMIIGERGEIPTDDHTFD